MPAKIRKLPNSNKVRVWWGGKVVAKETTISKAKAQIRLLGGVSHGMKLRRK